MALQVVKLNKLQKGDKVAVLSPSSGLAGVFPWVFELGLDRLKNVFGLEPIEFPTTRMLDASPQAKAKDICAAFKDPEIKAIFTAIGGDNQIKILKYIDTEAILANPKPFFGFSDNTNIIQLLWKLGIPAYYGGSILTQLAMQKAMQNITIESLNNALFNEGEVKIPQSSEFTDTDLDWAAKSNLAKTRLMEKNEGWYWDGSGEAKGILWGGCIETLVAQLSASIFLPDITTLKDLVIFLETAEDIPDHWIVESVLRAMGERGILQNANAILMGRPKAWQLEKQLTKQEKINYRSVQRDTVLRVVREYNTKAIVVQNMDFGHTDPQILVPSRNLARVNADQRAVYFTY